MAGIEEYKRLDIRFLHKNKYLHSDRIGYPFSLSWSRGDLNTGNISVRVEDGYLVLTYRYTRYGESEDVEERVCIDWTQCNYGGRRPWFKCPGCNRRVAVLALGGRLFLCRHCYRLKYSSQLETDMYQAHRRAGKLRERLSEGGRKPKRMHQQTYSKLLHRLNQAERQVDGIFTAKALRFLARSPSFREKYTK